VNRNEQWMNDSYVQNLISVIIPTYNNACFIRDTLNSLYFQTYRPIEVIVIDDGSIDETFSIVNEWENKIVDDSNFKLLYIYQKNKGAPSARNLGLSNSRGEFIQFIDSDDFIESHKFEMAANIMSNHSNVDFVYSLREDIDNNTKNKIAWDKEMADLENNLSPIEVALKPVWTALPVFRRKIIYDTGPWNEELACHQDWEYVARISSIANKAVRVPIAQAYCRQHKRERISNGKWGDLKGIISYNIASMVIYRLVLLEDDSQQKKIALQQLSQKCISCVRVAIATGEVIAAKKMILNDSQIFKTHWMCFLESIIWYCISCIPGKACQAIFGPIAKLKTGWFHREEE